MTPVVEKFFLDLPRAVKNYNRKCALKVECVGVVRPWEHEFFNRRLIWEEILWIDNLRLILFVVVKKSCLLWLHWYWWGLKLLKPTFKASLSPFLPHPSIITARDGVEENFPTTRIRQGNFKLTALPHSLVDTRNVSIPPQSAGIKTCQR